MLRHTLGIEKHTLSLRALELWRRDRTTQMRFRGLDNTSYWSEGRREEKLLGTHEEKPTLDGDLPGGGELSR